MHIEKYRLQFRVNGHFKSDKLESNVLKYLPTVLEKIQTQIAEIGINDVDLSDIVLQTELVFTSNKNGECCDE